MPAYYDKTSQGPNRQKFKCIKRSFCLKKLCNLCCAPACYCPELKLQTSVLGSVIPWQNTFPWSPNIQHLRRIHKTISDLTPAWPQVSSAVLPLGMILIGRSSTLDTPVFVPTLPGMFLAFLLSCGNYTQPSRVISAINPSLTPILSCI